MQEYNWTGWKLKNNTYGEEFDLEARKRMIEGSKKLLVLIEKYKDDFGDSILEVGPFFNPLITSNNFNSKKITYWDNDWYVINYLKQKKFGHEILFCDLNSLESINSQKGKFDSIIASHVFNYIDYIQFLIEINKFMNKNALIFINLSIDYGLPAFFSLKRPKTNNEILESLNELNFKILEKKEIETDNKTRQPNNRLLIVAQKIP